jgi:conjugative transfer signal peptidase TraF
MNGRLNRTALRRIAYGFGGLATLALVFVIAGLRINVTPSIPLGLYVRTDHAPAPGLVAEFCPTGMSATESERYRGFGLACPDRGIPLLKPVVATAGDHVEFSPAGLAVNGRSLPNTAPRELDSKGRSVRSWRSGPYTVEPGKIIVASSYHSGSYDSRYLGPIPIADVKCTLRPLWTIDRWDFGQPRRRDGDHP